MPAVRQRLVSVFLLLIAFGVRSYRLAHLGAQSDEGVHITVAERLAAGDVLYLELFENRTPGVEWLLALVFKVTGPSLLLGRLLGVAMALITVAALITAGRVLQRHFLNRSARQRRSGNWAAWVAAGLFALAPLAVFWGRFTMLEHWQAAAATLSVTCALMGATKGRVDWWLMAGILGGASLVAKQAGLTLVLAYGAYLLLAYLLGYRPNPRRGPLALIAGFSLLPLLALVVLGLQGSIASFFDSLSGASRLAPLHDLSAKWVNWFRWAGRRPLMLLALPGGVVTLSSGFSAAWLVVFWGIAEMGAIFAPPELDLGLGGFSHYVLPGLAALSLLAGVGAAWLVHAVFRQRSLRWAAAAIALLLIVTVPGWLTDLEFVVRQSTYPQPDPSQELAIGRATAAVTDEARPIVVLGTGIFYHLAGRRPANRYFHYPAYLTESELGTEANEELERVLGSGRPGAVLLSRLHLEDRLTEDVVDALWESWIPAARFQYPYQRDIFLLLPKADPARVDGAPTATFASGIQLIDLTSRRVDPETLLVQLQWRALDEQKVDWTVFVHVVDGKGELLGQHDGQPGVGFRPATTLRPGETIYDSHWITLGEAAAGKELALNIGLYDPNTGARQPIVDASEHADAFVETVNE